MHIAKRHLSAIRYFRWRLINHFVKDGKPLEII